MKTSKLFLDGFAHASRSISWATVYSNMRLLIDVRLVMKEEVRI
ncbi:hypothetical protein [Olivibacter sp. XZL3]|nr:hypothetical protein [Olivibacter sp. XZL3]